jgi:hypothetical protein
MSFKLDTAAPNEVAVACKGSNPGLEFELGALRATNPTFATGSEKLLISAPLVT